MVMQSDLSVFFNSFYLDYWNPKCDPLIRPLIEEYLPTFLTPHKWTAYLTNEPDEFSVVQRPVSIRFKEHPVWKDAYEEVCFSLLLKFSGKECIGIISAQLMFSFPDKNMLDTAVENLINICKEIENKVEIRPTDDMICIHGVATDTNAYLKPVYNLQQQQAQLFFCTVPYFFKPA